MSRTSPAKRHDGSGTPCRPTTRWSEVLGSVIDPELGADIVSLGMVPSVVSSRIPTGS